VRDCNFENSVSVIGRCASIFDLDCFDQASISHQISDERMDEPRLTNRNIFFVGGNAQVERRAEEP
jgi:hypothetical protein